jgi:LysR family transcriptional regulator, nitrogen assimilation regulatory protein
MDLKQIRYFVNVANLRSFSKAAEALHVAQSALSRHIQALERELETPLLFRTTRGVELSESGAVLLSMGETLLAQVEDIKAAVQHSKNLPSGAVTVGLPPSLSAMFAPILIQDSRSRYPEMEVRIIEGLGQFLEEWLRQGKIDLAVLTDLGNLANLAITRLSREEMVLVGAPEMIPDGREFIPLSEVTRLDLTITHGFRTVVDRLVNGTGLTLNYVEEFDSIPVIMDRIAGRPLLTILPQSFVHAESQTGRVRTLRITDPVLTRDLVIATNPRRARTAAIEAISGIIRKRISEVVIESEAPKASASRAVREEEKTAAQ